MAQDARTRLLTPGRAKVAVSSLMPMERFRMALESLGCTILEEEDAPPDALLFGPTLTIEGPFETAKEARWLVSDAKIRAHSHSLAEPPSEEFLGFGVLSPSGEFVRDLGHDSPALLDLPEGPAFHDERGWVIPVYQEV